MARSRPRPEPTDAVLARLTALHPRLIDLSLDRVWRLLAALDRPERRLPPALHVAGTNGKGSTIAYVRAMAEAAGRRVHVYTSPHLVRFNERIRLAGSPIADAHLLDALQRVERANRDQPITQFEAATAAAFLAFADVPADLLLLETGLGGRLDATNVIERPLLTAITPVSIDHTDFLGHTLAEIAGEKAGILKAGVPVALAPQPPEADAVLRARAHALGCPVLECAALDGLPEPALPGPHQIVNAGLAVACARRMGLTEAAIAAGLRAAEWPARLQQLSQRVWLDGGHNPAAGEALAAAIASWPRPRHLIVAMKANKDLHGFLAPLARQAEALHAIAIPDDDHCHAPEDIAAEARALGLAADAAPNVDAALKSARGAARVLICGSLYLAGSVLATARR